VTTAVIAAVLLAALMHAGWNTIAKLNASRAGDAAVVGVVAGVPAALCAPWAGIPDPACWPQLGASAVIHLAYFRVLALAYRGGDLSVAYPLMRGLPPMLVAGLGIALFGERLSLEAWCAVLVLLAGVLLLGWDGFARGSLKRGAAVFVALQVAIITSYILVDGSGVRASANAGAYIVWMFILTSLLLLPGTVYPLRMLAREGSGAVGLSVLGGLLTFGSYGIALWAMTRAPVALVAALRETSILFGAGFGAWLVGEPFGARRWTALALVLGGAAAMRLA
jgi:drug/metabolite transporter (DMT)-like permease